MASQTDVRSFSIVNGPSKFDFMVSLFEGNHRPRRTVNFRLAGFTEEVPVAITAVQQEDGSGESWNWEGNLHLSTAKSYQVKGYFGTKGRCGHFHFIVPFYNSWDVDKQAYVKVFSDTETQDLDTLIAEMKR